MADSEWAVQKTQPPHEIDGNYKEIFMVAVKVAIGMYIPGETRLQLPIGIMN